MVHCFIHESVNDFTSILFAWHNLFQGQIDECIYEFRIYVTEENDGVKRWDSMVLCHHWSESRLLELESAKLRKKS